MGRFTLRSRAGFIKGGFSLLLFLVLLGCATTVEKKLSRPSTFPEVKSNRPSLSFLQRPVMRADLSTLADKRRRKRLSLILREAPLGEVLRTVARERGFNIVFDKGVPVQEPVTIELRDVTFDEAMEVLSKSMGFGYVVDGDTVWVFTSQIDTKVFKLDSVNLERKVVVSSSISSGGEQGGEQEGGGSTSGGLSVDVTTLNQFNVWKDVGCNVCALVGLSCSSGGKGTSGIVKLCSGEDKFVAINRTTGHMIVTAEKMELQRVSRYLASVMSSLKKQVVLDVKIAEVELKDQFRLGVDWNKVFNNVFKTMYPITIKQTSTPLSEMQPVPPFFTFTVSPSPTARDPFSMAVSALQEYGNVRVLSAPRLAVVNNQAAVIKVGEDINFVTDVSSETNTETNTIGCDVDTDTYFVGVSLSLVPYINERGEVTLFVHPNVTQLKDVRTFRSECGDVPIEEPEFYVREMDTVVKVRDGDTMVIGGLITNQGQDLSYQTPLLGKLPGLGYLFSRRERLRRRTELFVFITPHVIYSPSPGASFGRSNVDILGER